MGVSIPYTPQEDKIIREMNAKDFTPEDISKALKSRTAKAIKDHAYDIGVRWTKVPEIDMAKFNKLMKGK